MAELTRQNQARLRLAQLARHSACMQHCLDACACMGHAPVLTDGQNDVHLDEWQRGHHTLVG